MTEHKIEIIPWPDIRPGEDFNRQRGRKAIMVDGVRWGAVHMTGRGVHGVNYWFQQEGIRGQICRKDPESRTERYRDEGRPVIVYSDKHYRWDKEPAPPLEDRLMNEARALVAEGLLIHPTVLEERNKVAAAAYRQRCEEAERERNREFTDKAAEALKPFANYVDVETMRQAVSRVANAMRWAQSR